MNRKDKLAALLTLVLLVGCTSSGDQNESPEKPQLNHPKCDVVKRQITVDGDPSDWEGVEANVVAGEEHLWFGQDMTREKWHDDADHSYRWRAAWHDNKLYFLFEVTDDRHIDPPTQENSFLNDCIEILLDPKNQKGERKVEQDGKETLRGYEIHFLPTSPVVAFVDDALSPQYPMDSPQTKLFEEEWSGEAAMQKTDDGYLVEIGFSVPELTLEPGIVFGLETGVGDDDGEGRKSLQMWSGNQVDFWITMDHYGEATLVEPDAP